jgi:hypothetical protein
VGRSVCHLHAVEVVDPFDPAIVGALHFVGAEAEVADLGQLKIRFGEKMMGRSWLKDLKKLD